MKFFLVSILSALLASATVLGAAKARIPSAPTALIYPDPGGILFPGFQVAAGTNPASLTYFEKAKSLQAAYSPALTHDDGHGYFGSFAYGSKNFGLGLGVSGRYLNRNNTNGVFLGSGYRFQKVALGLAIRDPRLSGSFSPNVDLGLMFGEGKGLTLGLVVYDIDNSGRMDLGVGFSGGKKFNVEANLLFPSFSRLSDSHSDYRVLVSANIFMDFLAVTLQSGYFTHLKEFSHTCAITAWFTEWLNLILQYHTPRTWTLGTSLVF